MYCGYYEEGDKCPECRGELYYPFTQNCSCHIDPPCSACVNKQLTCRDCGWEEEAPEYKFIKVAPGLSIMEFKPKPLDNTKIDYRIKMHSGSSQICEGVCPDGTSMEEVRKVVNGTFGGRFEYFRNGKFKFIAYTD